MGKSASIVRDTETPRFEDKVDFLSDPSSYRETPAQVTLRETNHAWLFMTDRHVYKMKKPFRRGGFDFSSLAARHKLCEDELRLNRRLAKDTYLDVVALVLNAAGELELEAEGSAVEWLVKMVRHPDSQALTVAAAADRAPVAEIRKLMGKLNRFYARVATAGFGPGGYTRHLRDTLGHWSRELRRAKIAEAAADIEALRQRLCAYLDANTDLLEKRAADGHIRDGHGDLRPEHVFLVEGDEPEIIDCLEFDPDLRRRDSADEIAYLAMESRHAGLTRLARDCYDCYRTEFDETAAPRHLWDFYAALAATVRAGLTAWRIPASPDAESFRRRVSRYLDDARHYIDSAHPH